MIDFALTTKRYAISALAKLKGAALLVQLPHTRGDTVELHQISQPNG